MSRHNTNGRLSGKEVAMNGKGKVFGVVIDPKTGRETGKPFSMGLNDSIDIQFNKEEITLKHSLSNKDVPFKKITTSIEPVLTIGFQDYNVENLELVFNAIKTKEESKVEVIEKELTAEDLEDGLFIITEQAVGDVEITDEDGLITYNENETYILNNGNIFILPLAEQTGSDVLTAGIIKVSNTGLASTTLEYGEASEIYLKIYIEMNNSYDDDKVYRYLIHKTLLSVDSLPIKGSGSEQLSYTAEFALFESNDIKASGASKFFKVQVSDKPEV